MVRNFIAGFVHGAMETPRAYFALIAIGCLLIDTTNSLLNQQSVEGD